jgi:general secretion pathway protein N
MIMRKYAVRILVIALPLCAGASAAISNPLDDQSNGVRAGASVASNWGEPTTTVAEVTIPPATPNASAERPLSANPLWAMPLAQFSVTRERPLFTPSRRPPAPPAAAVTVAKVVVPKPKEPEQPQLSLVGTIASDEDKFGIFVDQATKNVLRLRIGEDFQGWKLQSVQGRETTFQKNQLTFVVALPQPGLGQPVVAQPAAAVRGELAPVGVDAGKVVLPVNARQRPDR